MHITDSMSNHTQIEMKTSTSNHICLHDCTNPFVAYTNYNSAIEFLCNNTQQVINWSCHIHRISSKFFFFLNKLPNYMLAFWTLHGNNMHMELAGKVQCILKNLFTSKSALLPMRYFRHLNINNRSNLTHNHILH